MTDLLGRSRSLVLSERSVAITHVARRADAATDAQLALVLGTLLPASPRWVQAGSMRVLGLSPGRWLLLREPADYDFAADLVVLLKPAAAVCDQSDAYVVLRLCGDAVRPTLAKLIAIDLHERGFPVGQTAATVAAHIGVFVWRMPDDTGPVFELAIPRSYYIPFREIFLEAAAEFDVSVAD